MSQTSRAASRQATHSFHRAFSRARTCNVEQLEARCVLATSYLVHDLVSDQVGVAPITDPNLVNGWGIGLIPSGGAFWVSSNGKDISTLYTGDVSGSAFTKAALEVNIPGGAPTGQVFNSTTSDFVIHTSDMTSMGKATFIFASEAGEITGWNPNVPPPPTSTNAQLGFTAPDGAVYKGLALASDNGANYLYAADFHNDKIDVIDTNFHLAHLGGTFTDPNLPAGYAPFNVAAIGGQLYVTYAKQDAAAHDDVAGAGHGFIDVFTTDGVIVKRLVSRGKLDSPWGLAVAPANFGDFSNDLLVGNFGDGRINAYNPTTGALIGTLGSNPGHHPLVIDGLWGLTFGNGVTAGDSNTLYFAAGPDGEAHGLFGKITANPSGTSPIQAMLSGNVLNITGSPGDDHVLVRLKHPGHQIIVQSEGQQLGTFSASAVGTIEFQGFAGNDHVTIGPKITATTILDGGAGNDQLFGSDGSNILLGGPGDDLLMGGSHRDILIGGDGHDHLQGHQGDDILIGGTTAYDANSAALLQILAEWNSSDSFSTRMTKLQTGAGGLPKLDSTTVFDDGLRDLLFGGPGMDWIFAGLHDLQLQS